MLESKLEKLGFKPKEAKVYLGLLELGEGNIQQISQKSGIKRTTVYHVLEALKTRGLIGINKKGCKILYIAEDPRMIKQDFEEKQAYLNSFLPEILSLANFMDKKPMIRYYENMEGIKDIYRDELRHGNSELLTWWSESYETFGDEFFYKYYMPQRLKKKIWRRAIAPDNAYVRKMQKEDKEQLRRIRIMPNVKQNAELEITLYGKSKISVKSFEEKFGLIIESRPFYNTLKMIFEFTWQTLPGK